MGILLLLLFPVGLLFIVASYMVLGRVLSFVMTSQSIQNEQALQVSLNRSLHNISLLKGDLVDKLRQLEMLTGRLELNNYELQRLNSMKSKFMSMVVHDLRAPLTSIKGFSSLMLMHAQNDNDKKMLSYIEKATDHMGRLVADLTDLAMIESGKLRMEKHPFDFTQLIQELAIGLAVNAKNKKVVFNAPVSPQRIVVIGDRYRLSQVIMNLASNAIKFTPPKGRIDVYTALEGSSVKVVVKDTGPGIAPSEQKRIFEKFYQAKSMTDPSLLKQGWGLGLSIARDVVLAHNGQIGVESKGLGKGCSFWFKIPAQFRRSAQS